VAASLALDDRGSGDPALLLLTGWCSSRERWAVVAQACSARRRTVSFDWRGHGDSPPAPGDFGVEELGEDALAVIESLGLRSFVPCSASHSGWVAIELARRLPDRVAAIVHVDWMVAEPSAPYLELLERLQHPESWAEAREQLFTIWRGGIEQPAIEAAIEVMREQGEEMWIRSGREIAGSYRRHGMPLALLDALPAPPRVLHVYGQPPDPAYLEWQRRAAGERDWFEVRRLEVASHFTMIEAPRALAREIERVAAAAGA